MERNNITEMGNIILEIFLVHEQNEKDPSKHVSEVYFKL
jgi:hypothetical protein